jgi:hypothetical protein
MQKAKSLPLKRMKLKQNIKDAHAKFASINKGENIYY